MKSLLICLIISLPLAAQLTDSGARVGKWDLMNYGAKCDGSTDDTTPLNNAIAFVIAAGGTLTLPQGKTCLISGQVAIPNSGAAKALQNGLRITGSGSGADSYGGGGGATSSGGSTLDMRYANNSSATDGKILTLGVGKLEIDHVMFTDGGSDTTPFIYTTNTTLLIHHNTIEGDGAGQDFVVMGGTASTSIGNTAAAPFQGYGTVIDSNFADKIGRLAYLRTFANGIQIVNNTVWSRSAGTAAIELDGSAATAEGNYIAGNLIEISGYTYGVKLTKAVRNTFAGNSFWDPTSTTTSFINAAANATANILMIGERTGAKGIVDGAGAPSNLIIDGKGARLIGTGVSCADTNNDIGSIWFDTGTTTTVMKVCMYVAGTLGWVTK